MARYLILGAGKFGRLALERLSGQEAQAEFLVVERASQALAAARSLTSARAQWLEAEAGAFLAESLNQAEAWDWLIPAIPEHVAFIWLRQGLLAGTDWETIEVPALVATLTPLAIRGREGELYLSRARHLCPDDCAEPEVCPVTGEPRETPLYEELAALEVPGFRTAVISSRQLAPGVGGFPPVRLAALAQELADLGGKALVATACRCHGVVHALERRSRE